MAWGYPNRPLHLSGAGMDQAPSDPRFPQRTDGSGLGDSFQVDAPYGIPSDAPMLPMQDDLASMPEVQTKRRCLAGTSFVYANVTSLGQHVRQWLVGRDRTPIFLAETHLGPDDHEKTVQ